MLVLLKTVQGRLTKHRRLEISNINEHLGVSSGNSKQPRTVLLSLHKQRIGTSLKSEYKTLILKDVS